MLPIFVAVADVHAGENLTIFSRVTNRCLKSRREIKLYRLMFDIRHERHDVCSLPNFVEPIAAVLATFGEKPLLEVVIGVP